MKAPWYILCVSLTAAGLVWMAGCSRSAPLSSGSVETTNGISGTIRDADGHTVADARVLLLTDDHIPYRKTLPKQLAIRSKKTDNDGWFRFDSVSPGTYNIQASHPDVESALLIKDIRVTEENGADSLDGVFKEPGTIIIHLLERGVTNGDYIYIPGTSIFREINAAAIEAGLVSIDGIPPAMYEQVLLVRNGELPGANLIRESLTVTEGGTSVIGPYSTWSTRMTITINTGSDGAAVDESIISFPLLLRLSSAGFDFTGVRPDGTDLRFTKSDGITPLSYEIESWDPVNGTAAVWIKMDTVYGNNESQHIYLYTGQSDAPDQSSGSAVFDTAAGFIGVWHMHQSPMDESGGPVDVLPDATGNNLHGSAAGGMTVDDLVEGTIDGALELDGLDDYFNLGDPPELALGAQFSFSAWARMDWENLDTGYMIVDKFFLDSNDNRHGYAFYVYENRLRLSIYSGADSMENALSPDFLTGTGWKHLAASYDGAAIRLYVDGREVISVPWAFAPAPSLSQVNIGRRESSAPDNNNSVHYFNGALDEIRVSGSTRSSDWFKLSYENQKENSTVVSIE